jgi:hypothetical protein
MKKSSNILFIICSSLLLFFLFFWLFNTVSFIHETGHIVFGSLDGLMRGERTSFTISAWSKGILTPEIPLPQQTKIIQGKGSLNFALGGPIFTILVFLALSAYGYIRSKKLYWFIPFICISLIEISGNVICGTDNLYFGPLSICNKSISLTIMLISISLFSAFFAILSAIELEKRINYK